MVLLALTTSTDKGSLAILKDGEILSVKSWEKKTHSEVLTYNFNLALRSARLKPDALTAIAVDRGPGSFTGCRMAVNMARTLGYSLKIPLFATTSLNILAYEAASAHEGPICA